MLFEREEDVLAWYESEERVLTPDYLKTIPWQDIARYELDPKFIPVLLYMRDIERFTEVYYDELCRTPTGEDPVIKKFMDRWRSEETLHSDLLNRFLNEAGHPTSEKWFEEAKAKVDPAYWRTARTKTRITNLFGKRFSAVHMTWGAIQECSTLNGYQRLWTMARHPVLEYILRAVVREEARHTLFYWSIARIKLIRSPVAQRLARYLVDHFWRPVGQGIKSEADTNLVISTLFHGKEGMEIMDKKVNGRLEQLPGFLGDKVVTNRVAEIALRA